MHPVLLFSNIQAIALDSNEKYVEQLKHYLHRFTLRAKIYVEPKTNLDKAAKIVEQVILLHAVIQDVLRINISCASVKTISAEVLMMHWALSWSRLAIYWPHSSSNCLWRALLSPLTPVTPPPTPATSLIMLRRLRKLVKTLCWTLTSAIP